MSANEELRDASISHAVNLSRYTNNVVRRMIGVLKRSDARLADELRKALEGVSAGTFKAERLESLLVSVRKVINEAYATLGEELTAELKEFAGYEAQWQELAIKDVLPASVSVASVTGSQVYAAAMARPFQGVLLKGALKDLDQLTARKIRQAIAQGFVEGRTTDQIIRDVMGTKAKGYADGLLERSRRDVEAIVRTAVSHTAGVAQDEVMKANDDLVKAVVWSSTLDLRTSETCRVRDGKQYHPVTHKPIGHSLQWLGGPGRAHWRCRSSQVPVLKSWKELGIDLEGEANQASTRASLDGQVPAETTYAEWIRQQSSQRKIEILGPARARLLDEGGLKLEDLYSQRGEYLTLPQLRERDMAAFKRAGLE